jgi:hypothetical protein
VLYHALFIYRVIHSYSTVQKKVIGGGNLEQKIYFFPQIRHLFQIMLFYIVVAFIILFVDFYKL